MPLKVISGSDHNAELLASTSILSLPRSWTHRRNANVLLSFSALDQVKEALFYLFIDIHSR